jgi:hypothetical protein
MPLMPLLLMPLFSLMPLPVFHYLFATPLIFARRFACFTPLSLFRHYAAAFAAAPRATSCLSAAARTSAAAPRCRAFADAPRAVIAFAACFHYFRYFFASIHFDIIATTPPLFYARAPTRYVSLIIAARLYFRPLIAFISHFRRRFHAVNFIPPLRLMPLKMLLPMIFSCRHCLFADGYYLFRHYFRFRYATLPFHQFSPLRHYAARFSLIAAAAGRLPFRHAVFFSLRDIFRRRHASYAFDAAFDDTIDYAFS